MGFPSPANDHFKKRGVINMECCIHQPTSSTFSPEQEQAALLHLKPTLDVVVKLCSEVKIQIKKILISCSELLELARSIPSIAETNKTIDMSSALCQPVMYLALLTEGYYAGAVKETDIEYHCRLISRYNK